jgi:Uma2 family endonuclease
MSVEQKLMTAADLLRLPRGRARHELVRGELRTMPPGGWEHGREGADVLVSLANHARDHALGGVTGGDTGFLLTTNPDTVRAPDVGFVRRERVPARGSHRGYFLGAPDLAVEVISPNDLYTEVDEKVAEWLEHGTRLVFVVNPRRRTVAVHRADGSVRILTVEDVLDGEDVVPGWTLPVRDIFGAQ